MSAIYNLLLSLGQWAGPHNSIVQKLIDVLSNPAVAMVIAIVVPCLIIFLLVQAVAGGSTYIERKLAADIQRRVGPNKCNIGAFFGEFARATVNNGKSPNAGAPES